MPIGRSVFRSGGRLVILPVTARIPKMGIGVIFVVILLVWGVRYAIVKVSGNGCAAFAGRVFIWWVDTGRR